MNPMIRFQCDECGKRIGVPDDQRGLRVRCPYCQAVNLVPPPAETRKSAYLADHQISSPAPTRAAAGYQIDDADSPSIQHASPAPRRPIDPVPLVLLTAAICVTLGLVIGIVVMTPDEERTEQEAATGFESIDSTPETDGTPDQTAPPELTSPSTPLFESGSKPTMRQIMTALPSLEQTFAIHGRDRSHWMLSRDDRTEHRAASNTQVRDQLPEFIALHNRPTSDLYPQAYLIHHLQSRIDLLFSDLGTIGDHPGRFLYEPGQLPVVFTNGGEGLTALITGLSYDQIYDGQTTTAEQRAADAANAMLIPAIVPLLRAFDDSQVQAIGIIVNYGTRQQLSPAQIDIHPEAAALIVSIAHAKRFIRDPETFPLNANNLYYADHTSKTFQPLLLPE